MHRRVDLPQEHCLRNNATSDFFCEIYLYSCVIIVYGLFKDAHFMGFRKSEVYQII